MFCLPKTAWPPTSLLTARPSPIITSTALTPTWTSIIAGAEVYRMPLLKENGFLPDLDAIPESARKKAKLLYLNYPNKSDRSHVVL